MICDVADDNSRSPIDRAVGLDPAVKVLRSQPTFPVSIATGTVRPLGAGVSLPFETFSQSSIVRP